MVDSCQPSSPRDRTRCSHGMIQPMQIAPLPAPATTPAPIEQPKGWSPGAVSPSTSTRAGGLVRGGIDAWRGVPERSVGVGLTDAMVDTLGPFLAGQMGLSESIVRSDLHRTRVHVGGLAKDAGGTATTIGHAIYVSDARRATRMLGWTGRTWLVHELAHTMQWRRSAASSATGAQRDQAFLNRYLAKYVSHDGSITKGGLAMALRELLSRRDPKVEADGIGEVIHDTHPMEVEAARVAIAFRDRTR